MIALPVINVITGVVVSGLAHGGHARLSDFGVSIAAAVVVAFTISLELTLLVTREILQPLDDLRRATERVADGDLTARAPVVSNDETGELAKSFNEMVAGLEERRRLHEALGAYVDEQIAERVLSEGLDLAGEDVEVSILFLDVRDFTSFAEQASAREVVARLNELYDVVVPILRRHGGHTDKFLADGVLGVFGAPERYRDHADRAIAAGLELVDAVRDRFRGAVEIGIGVNSGPVVAGTVGGGGRVEFTVIGDAANTAARVEELTRETGDELLITEATRCLLVRELACDLEERGAVSLKGKSEIVKIWALVPRVEQEGIGRAEGEPPLALPTAD
jgi:class 3 adenylate cyclase